MLQEPAHNLLEGERILKSSIPVVGKREEGDAGLVVFWAEEEDMLRGLFLCTTGTCWENVWYKGCPEEVVEAKSFCPELYSH
jgi:hypothetical protein